MQKVVLIFVLDALGMLFRLTNQEPNVHLSVITYH